MGSIIDHVERVFNLNESEKSNVGQCIKNYAEALSNQEAIANCVRNAVQSLKGESSWQVAKDILEKKSFFIVSSRLITPISESSIREKASVISDFVLKYLVTKESIRRDTNRELIPKNMWFLYKMNEMTIDAVIDRLVIGNGQELADLSKPELIGLFQREKQQFHKDIEIVNSFIENGLQNSRDYNLIDVPQLVLQINHISTAFNTLFSSNDDLIESYSDKQLNDLLQKVRDMHRRFIDFYHTIEKIVTYR